jgi:probable HAF family extracellular repeat protein
MRISILLQAAYLGGFTLVIAACDPSTPTRPAGDSRASQRQVSGGLTVTGTSPSATARDTTLEVHVLGSGFTRGGQVTFLLAGALDPRVRTTSTRFINSGDLLATVTIAADAVPEQYDVEVALASGKKGIGTELFTVLSMIDLGLPGGSYSYGRDVNASGTVVGEYEVRKTGCRRAYVWTPEHGGRDLPVPPGTCIAGATALNHAGTIVGWASVSGRHVALRWTRGPQAWTVEQLPPPAGYTSGDALAISSAGHIVGAYLTPDFFYDYFVWTPGSGWQLVQGTDAECWKAAGNISAVNSAGMLVGGDCAGALVWATPAGPPTRLPSADPRTFAWDVNDAGVIVGKGYAAEDQRRAVEWRSDAAGDWSVVDLGDLGGAESEALSVNDLGQVAGWSNATENPNAFRAFLWTPGRGMEDLGSLLHHGSAALALANAAPGGPLYLSGWSVDADRGTDQRAVRWTE